MVLCGFGSDIVYCCVFGVICVSVLKVCFVVWLLVCVWCSLGCIYSVILLWKKDSVLVMNIVNSS